MSPLTGILTRQLRPVGENPVMGATGGKNTPRHRRDAARLVIDTSRTISAVTDEIGTRERPVGGWEANDLTASPPWHLISYPPPLKVSETRDMAQKP